MKEFNSVYANVKYIEKDQVVLLTWKQFCSHEDYRQPTLYALELLKSHKHASFVVDARNGFEDDKEDVEWGFQFLLPQIGKSGCKKAGFIMNETNEIQDEMNMWFVEFQKYVTLYQDTQYDTLVQKMKSDEQIQTLKQRKPAKGKSEKHVLKTIGIVLVSLLLILVAVTGIYLSDYYRSLESIQEYIEQSDLSIVQEESLIIISGENDNHTGIIFYPGGKVEYTAYVPLLEELANYGYTCYLPKMPGNLAVFGVNKAASIIESHPETTTWILAGHSLGGAMAASYASENSEKLSGLVLLGAYPVSDLKNTGLKVLSILGSNDLITNQENYEKGKTYVSEDSEYFTLEGGNHGYFGNYGMQDGDGAATISAMQQWEETASKIYEFFGPVTVSEAEVNSELEVSEAEVNTVLQADSATAAALDEDYDFNLLFGGDINFDENWGTMEYYNQQPDGIERCISKDLVLRMQQADLMCLNNEFTYSDEGTPLNGKLYTFRAKPERVAILEELGVDLVNLANNHVYDYGEDAFFDTLNTLKENGIPYIGAGANLQEASAPVYFTLEGKTIAYVAASRAEKFKMTPQATNDSPGIILCYDTTQIIETIKEARENADFVIAYIHWGTEYSYELEDIQREDGKAFIDAGADVVIGAHPHCLQGMEYYKGKPVIYSLGNLWFNEKTLDTMLLNLHFYKEGDKVGMGVEVIPAIQKDYQTRGVTQAEEKERIFSFLESISVNVEIDEGGIVTESGVK